MLAFRPANAPATGATAATPAAAGTAPARRGAALDAPKAALDTPRAALDTPRAAPAALDAPKVVSDAAAAPDRTATAAGPDEWPAIVAALEAGLPRQLAASCVLIGREGSTVRLALDPRSTTLRTPGLEDKLAQALSRYFGARIRLEFALHDGAAETPARAMERAEGERRARARAAFEADPVVTELKERFGASVLPDTVRPAESSE
jgi:DNA polymerase-3 subunit gamma/tau